MNEWINGLLLYNAGLVMLLYVLAWFENVLSIF